MVIDPPADLARYADTLAVSTITLAELSFGLHTADPVTNAARQLRFERILATFEPIPYSATSARLYGGLCAAVSAQGRDPKPRRFDLLLASVAAELTVPILTRNPDDLRGLPLQVRVVAVA